MATQSRGYLLVGIDFGTTYSGIAWGWSERPEVLNVVMDWDGIEGQKTNVKVPTKILYKGNQIKWGFDIPPDEKPLQWFKLLLLREEDMVPPYMDAEVRNSAYLKEAREMLLKLNKSAEAVVADYLGLLWKHLLKSIRTTNGQASIDGQPFRVVITFPAIWPLYAQSRMRKAAYAAGIMDPRHGGETELTLCPEPEAAAIAVMDDFDGHPVESGDIFVICDAGGGTADLITYRLEDITMWEMSECVGGAGKLCGAMLVDEAFDKKMGTWIGESKWAKLADSTKREWMGRYWEDELKRSFNGTDRDYRITLPVQVLVKQSLKINMWPRKKTTSKPERKGLELRLQRADIEGVFDGTINQIVQLVLEQIHKTRQRENKPPKAVFLVGGFGQSPYLYSRLQQEVRQISSATEVRRPSQDRAWGAIVRGALLKASILNRHDGDYLMRADIISRKVRTSYGIAIIEPFDPDIHSQDDRQYVAALGKECAVNQMHWYIQMNENVTAHQFIRLDWSRKIRSPLPRQRFTVTLLKCDRENPPRRRNDDVRVEGEIVCHINTPFDHLPQYTNPNGEVWRSLDFQVEMKPCGTMVEFAAYYNGQRQRALQVNPPFATSEGDSALRSSMYAPSPAIPLPDQPDLYSLEEAQISRRNGTPPRLMNGHSV
ncbi:hypothetical protein ONS95_008363 [Cadophora gregata]|uniref:uncharacterized protein n=1 Tax=Cadophora gregata TaxID=51156 RepID=UPI0026DCB560|nr:uncharacterized protein ONS95_008363 [Cadophora gregata]KAK0100415.1 hypothetical protein ONS96_007692 [Cadophora gregata f. sp. sojae]KAK0126783.1 hypothetical protein ONS95_008363 [Cadophora gregata]